MADDQIKTFLERLNTDAAFRSQLEKAAESTEKPGKAVRNILTEAGFTFSFEDYTKATETKGVLTNQELGQIVGGLLKLRRVLRPS